MWSKLCGKSFDSLCVSNWVIHVMKSFYKCNRAQKSILNEHIYLVNVSLNRHTQLFFATGIEGGIHHRQVLKYQPPVTSRVIFHHLIPLMIIKY